MYLFSCNKNTHKDENVIKSENLSLIDNSFGVNFKYYEDNGSLAELNYSILKKSYLHYQIIPDSSFNVTSVEIMEVQAEDSTFLGLKTKWSSHTSDLAISVGSRIHTQSDSNGDIVYILADGTGTTTTSTCSCKSTNCSGCEVSASGVFCSCTSCGLDTPNGQCNKEHTVVTPSSKY